MPWVKVLLEHLKIVQLDKKFHVFFFLEAEWLPFNYILIYFNAIHTLAASFFKINYLYLFLQPLENKNDAGMSSDNIPNCTEETDPQEHCNIPFCNTNFFFIIIIWFVRLLALRPFLAYCASLGW
jgi:hypothetical protein